MATTLKILPSNNNQNDLYTLAGVKIVQFSPDNGTAAFATVQIGRDILNTLREASVVDADEAAELDRQMVDAGVAENVVALLDKVFALDIPVEADDGQHQWNVERCSCEHTVHAVLRCDKAVVARWPNLAAALDDVRVNTIKGFVKPGQAIDMLRKAKALNLPADQEEELKNFEALAPEIKEQLLDQLRGLGFELVTGR